MSAVLEIKEPLLGSLPNPIPTSFDERIALLHPDLRPVEVRLAIMAAYRAWWSVHSEPLIWWPTITTIRGAREYIHKNNLDRKLFEDTLSPLMMLAIRPEGLTTLETYSQALEYLLVERPHEW